MLGRFVIVVVLLFLVFWSSSRCRVPRRHPVVVVLVPWYHLRRRRRGRWPPLFVLEHPRSTLLAAVEWVLGGLRRPVVVVVSSFNYCLKKVC